MVDLAELCLERSWCPFVRRGSLHDDQTLFEFKKSINADGNDLRIFFTDHQDTTSLCEVEILEDFFQGISLADVKSGVGTAGSRRAVWLDDRDNNGGRRGSPYLDGGGGDAREYPNPLTATGLYQALHRRRFSDEEGLPDAARRLIYINNLDPASIHALAVTASHHQAPVLRDAIYKHLAFQTSIAVKIPSAGLHTFQFDLHLPFFKLRKSTRPEESVGKVNTKPRRQWTDLSFLNIDKPSSQVQERKEFWGIHEAQISCVVSGWDDARWVGYGFVDDEIDGVLAESSKDDLIMDQIAAGEIQANFPIWRPREYWLKVFEIRIKRVRHEWEWLIYKLEFSIKQYVIKLKHS